MYCRITASFVLMLFTASSILLCACSAKEVDHVSHSAGQAGRSVADTSVEVWKATCEGANRVVKGVREGFEDKDSKKEGCSTVKSNK